MICPSCGGKTKKGQTNLPVELETGILYIKNVPADVCDQCGESYIPDEAAAVVEEIVAKAKQLKVEVEVVSFPGAA